jgi:hypothetical protein
MNNDDFATKMKNRRSLTPLGRKSSLFMNGVNSQVMNTQRSKSTARKEHQRMTLKSNIFKGRLFYVSESFRSKRTIIRRILENSGNIIRNVDSSSKIKTTLLVIVKDGDKSCPQKMESLKKLNKKFKFRYLSPRFLDYCLSRGQYVSDPLKN